MKFLLKIFGDKYSEENVSSDEIDIKPPLHIDLKSFSEQDASSGEPDRKCFTYTDSKRKKEEANNVVNKRANIVCSEGNEESSRIMSFFKGIAPTVEKFSEEDIVEFQFEVMNTIRNIVQRNQISFTIDTN